MFEHLNGVPKQDRIDTQSQEDVVIQPNAILRELEARYKEITILGCGGFATVIKAHDSLENVDVAIKICNDGCIARNEYNLLQKVHAHLLKGIMPSSNQLICFCGPVVWLSCSRYVLAQSMTL